MPLEIWESLAHGKFDRILEYMFGYQIRDVHQWVLWQVESGSIDAVGIAARHGNGDCGTWVCPKSTSAASNGAKSHHFHVIFIWVCLKIGYIPNYSHLIGIMIINHWV